MTYETAPVVPMNETAILITFFGKFPTYIDYFLETCGHNKSIDFIFFIDDRSYRNSKFPNVSFIYLDKAAFNALATEKIGVPVNIRQGYKLCDLRPMYGVIYEEYLASYTFWGYCDTDMLFGDIATVLTPDLLNNHDIISSHSRYMSGPFSLYRNIAEVNTLFRKSKDYQRVIQDDRNFLFDEASSVIAHLWEGHDIFDFESEVESMTHLVKNESKHSLRVKFAGFITERVKDKLRWQNGQLLTAAGEEVFVFHYITYKGKLSFNVPPYRGEPHFFFTPNGFFLANLRSYGLDWPLSFITNFRTKLTRKLRTIVAARRA